MSYRILYGNNGIRQTKFSAKKKKNEIVGLFVVIVIIFSLFGFTMKKEEREIANIAFQKFVDGIKEGNNLADAVTVFCQDIIESANVH